MRRGFVLFARIEAFCSAVIVKQPSSDNTPYEKIGDEVYPVDTPFDIPDSWEWVRFKDLVDYSMGKNASTERDGILEQRYAPLGFYCGFGGGWDCDCN